MSADEQVEQVEHVHEYEIHYTATDWQIPLFIKCQGCGRVYRLAAPTYDICNDQCSDL